VAKYFASPFGTIIGKVNGQVGSRWRGLNILKKYTIPADRGTLLTYQQYKAGSIPPDRFSFPQFNLRRVIVNPLMFMSRNNPEFIQTVWKSEVKKRDLNMSGNNLLTKANIATLYASMDRDAEFDPITNTPDLTKLVMSMGTLEPTKAITAKYATGTGIVTLTWNTDHFMNGADTDAVSCVIVKKPILEEYGEFGNWRPALSMYYIPIVATAYPTPPGSPKSRKDGGGTVTIDSGLTATDLTAFIFFFQSRLDLTHDEQSGSVSVQVTVP
jgi:hypothetical protein